MHSIDTEREAATFLWELKAEFDACRRQVDALTDELCAQRVEFATYKASTEAQLSDLRKHKTTSGREVLALRRKLDEAGHGPTTAAATRREERAEAPDRGTEEFGAAPDIIRSGIEDDQNIGAARVSVESKTAEDEKLKSLRNLAEECDAAMKMEEPTDGALPGTAPGTAGPALAASPTPERPGPAQKSIRRKKALGPGAARDRILKKDRVMQQRMLLLRHAYHCTAPEGTCKACRHCATTKALLKHIIEDGCTDPKCGVRHCVSSRYVMRKYQRWCASPLARRAACRAVKSSDTV